MLKEKELNESVIAGDDVVLSDRATDAIGANSASDADDSPAELLSSQANRFLSPEEARRIKDAMAAKKKARNNITSDASV